MELWLCNYNNKCASLVNITKLQIIKRSETGVRLPHHPFAISGVSSKIIGIKVTLSFLGGALRFVFPVLFWSPIQYMLQPMRKMKNSIGRRKSVKMLLRLRLPFLAFKFAPDYLSADYKISFDNL